MCDLSRNSGIKIGLHIVMVSEGTLIVIANTLTLVTFAINKNLTRRSTYLLLSVATADAMAGLSAIFENLTRLTTPCPKTTLGDVIVFVGHIFTRSSLYGLILVAVERMYATLCPLRHYNSGKRIYIISIALQWLVGSAVATAAVLEKNNSLVDRVKSAIAFTGLLAICVCYGAIFAKVKKHHQIHHRAALPRTQQRERELAKTLFIVTVISLLTWLPDTVYHLIQGNYFEDQIEETHLIFMALRLINSLVNPIVYLLRMPEFRKAVKHIVNGTAEQRRTEPNDHHLPPPTHPEECDTKL